MREAKRTNYILLTSLLMIAVAFAAYAALILRWFSTPRKAEKTSLFDTTKIELSIAKDEMRERLLDPRAHLRLSQALWKAGRPIDSFYVSYNARQLFSDEEFRQAHAIEILGIGGPVTRILDRLKGLKDKTLSVPIYAQAIRDYPNTPESRDALNQLSKMASISEMGADGEISHYAKTALEELYRVDPKNPDILMALGQATLGRGDMDQAAALANEAWDKNPGQAGAAHILALIAMKAQDQEATLKWLQAAWDKNPDDLFAAEKLAQIYINRRNDPEGALPFYLALYRHSPDYSDEMSADLRIRQILDRRRENLLKNVNVDGLSERFKLDDASLRAEACLRAANFKDPKLINDLSLLLDDDTELVRQSADYALFQIAKNYPDEIQAQREKWLQSEKPFVRMRALNLFADLDGVKALDDIEQALQDSNPGVRAYARAMVLDHYFKNNPKAAKIRSQFNKTEQNKAVLEFVKRFS